MKIRYSSTLPLRFYFDSVKDRHDFNSLFITYGADEVGFFIEVSDADFGEMLLKKLAAEPIKLVIGRTKISLKPLKEPK